MFSQFSESPFSVTFVNHFFESLLSIPCLNHLFQSYFIHFFSHFWNHFWNSKTEEVGTVFSSFLDEVSTTAISSFKIQVSGEVNKEDFMIQVSSFELRMSSFKFEGRRREGTNFI